MLDQSRSARWPWPDEREKTSFGCLYTIRDEKQNRVLVQRGRKYLWRDAPREGEKVAVFMGGTWLDDYLRIQPPVIQAKIVAALRTEASKQVRRVFMR